jgi:hypothetical protein
MCTSADLATLKQTLRMVVDLMRHTGVGGLPLLPATDGSAPTEEQLVAQTTRAVQEAYDQLKRREDAAAVVANLFSLQGIGNTVPRWVVRPFSSLTSLISLCLFRNK